MYYFDRISDIIIIPYSSLIYSIVYSASHFKSRINEGFLNKYVNDYNNYLAKITININ